MTQEDFFGFLSIETPKIVGVASWSENPRSVVRVVSGTTAEYREEVELSGRATLYSWAKPVHPPLPMFPPGYLIALVELEEGMRMLSNLCDVEPADIEVGMPLEVFFAPTADGGAVHQFRPRRPR